MDVGADAAELPGRAAPRRIRSRVAASDASKPDDAPPDRDRHTEVGGPPTGPAPRYSESALGPSAPPGPRPPRAAAGAPPGYRVVWALLAAAAVAGGGTAVWALTRPPEKQIVTQPAPPAAAAT